MIRRALDLLTSRILDASGLFDPYWYTSFYNDVADLPRRQALEHYILQGAVEGRDPSPIFGTAFYLSQFPTLEPRNINPLCHYIIYGEKAGAWPNPWFDPVFVDAVLPTDKRNGSLLSAYKALGPTALNPSAGFDAAAYLSERPILRAAGMNPLWHFACAQRSDFHPPPITAPELACIAKNDLVFVGMQEGCNLFHVAGGDPYLVFQKADETPIASGHYQLKCAFSGPDRALARAKVYVDYGLGFSEAYALPLFFEKSTGGTVTANLSLEQPAVQLRFDPMDAPEDADTVIGIGPITLSPMGRFDHYSKLAARIAPAPAHRALLGLDLGVAALRGGPAAAAAKLRALDKERCKRLTPPPAPQISYQKWIAEHDTIGKADFAAMAEMLETFIHRPLISIIMPVYNTPEDLLCECIDSVLSQTYPDWELCIADDNSPKPHVRKVLERYMQCDTRIKVVFRTENGHISKASNSALDLANGSWIALLDHDDLLPPHALFCIAETINRKPHAAVIYSDEDKIDMQGNRTEPYFKSEWNERLFFEQNMVSHLGAFRRDLVRKVGGFRQGFEGSQDHDLVLRMVEHVRDDQIVHIPHILYHWRILPGSTAMGAGEKSYAVVAGAKALDDALKRRGIAGTIEINEKLGYYRLRLEPPNPPPLVSIIIPTRDGLDVLEPCIRSVQKLTTYPNYEILIVDNQSAKPETHEYFDSLRGQADIRVLPYDDIFNYSAINNFAARQSAGSLICLLNNDTEVISRNWLTEMVAELSRDTVGAVGAKLLYTDETVQHAGVVLGVGTDRGVAGHGLLSIPRDHGGYFSYALLAREVSAATAACLLVRREVFELVGGLNEPALRVAFNDVDLCLKIRELGYRIVWTPHALLHHHESKSRGAEDTPEKQVRFLGEIEYMLATWGERLRADPYYNPNLSLNAETYTLSNSPRVLLPWRNAYPT